MAPRGPAKTRDFDYSNLGTHGRRTGITLKEGRRDEHGMEEIDGMFSSPEKSPVRVNGFGHGDESVMGSDGMSMDEGNGPDIGDFLNSANGRKAYFPPPVTRSPMKSRLSGSARRTPGIASSPRAENGVASSSASEGDDLGAQTIDSRHDVSPLTSRSVNAPTMQPNGLRRTGLKNARAKEMEVTADFSDDDSDHALNGDKNGDVENGTREDFAEEYADADDIHVDETTNLVEDGSGERESEAESPSGHASLNARNRSAADNASSSTGRAAKANTEPGAKRKRAGRPPKVPRIADVDEDTGDVDPRPAKKAKSAGQRPARVAEPLDPELNKVVENYANRTGPLKGRSLYILKREVPTESAATHTRSGRVSVRPLAYWRNERCVYGDGDAEVGHRFPLSTIKEIIRTEEIEPEKKTSGRKSRSQKKRRSKKSRDDDSEDDEAETVDLWEQEGVLHGYIRKWDAETQTATTEEDILDIAYAPAGIETKEVKDSTFRFAKLISSSFIGSGIVELPPGGVKKPKNAKKMHMVFYVCHGRVQVDISGIQFSAGKGCVFQVPRGNYYSFANTHRKDARLFFTQGCVPAEGDDAVPGSALKSTAPERQPAPEPTPSAGPARGRPKGKQKASKA